MSCLFLLQLISFVHISLTFGQQFGKVEWVSYAGIKISELEPAGVEGNLTHFVARFQLIHPNTFIPGKCHWSPETGLADHAEISYNGTEFKVTNLQLLRFPFGAVSWIPGEGHQSITPNHIFGGVDPETMEEVYVCRAWHELVENNEPVMHPLPGKYVPSRGVCSVPDGEDHFIHLTNHVIARILAWDTYPLQKPNLTKNRFGYRHFLE